MLTSQSLEALGKKAFAVAVNQCRQEIFPKTENVVFSPGILFHECSYTSSGGIVFHGNFYHRDLQNDNDGTVLISMIEYRHHNHTSYPHSWHFLFDIHNMYSEMGDLEIIEWTSDENSRNMHKVHYETQNGSEVCPECKGHGWLLLSGYPTCHVCDGHCEIPLPPVTQLVEEVRKETPLVTLGSLFPEVFATARKIALTQSEEIRAMYRTE